jgi:hypothetical protein
VRHIVNNRNLQWGDETSGFRDKRTTHVQNHSSLRLIPADFYFLFHLTSLPHRTGKTSVFTYLVGSPSGFSPDITSIVHGIRLKYCQYSSAVSFTSPITKRSIHSCQDSELTKLLQGALAKPPNRTHVPR